MYVLLLLSSTLLAQEPPPQGFRALEPKITFSLDDGSQHHDALADADSVDAADGLAAWRTLARKAASLHQLPCSDDLLGATTRMVDEAEKGDSLAMAALGVMYLLGQQCAPKRNLTWGLHWLTEAEERGQPDAQAMMAFLHASDALHDVYGFTGLEANRTHARVLYEKAAKGGSAFGAMAVAFRHAHGIGVRESCPDSAVWYEQAAEAAVDGLDETRRKTPEMSNAGDQDHLTLLSLGMKSAQQDGRQPMDKGTVEYLDYCAHIGDVSSKVAMGHLYHSGTHGVPCDKRAAYQMVKEAAHLGDGTGHAHLGLMRLRERKFRAAIRSLRRATKVNEASAWAGLGYAHLYGAGLPQSDERAAQSLWTAARMGHLDSIYNLGVLTLHGRGVKQSVRDGFRLLSVAAEFSHPQAQLQVGHMVRLGRGVRKDCASSQFFLKHAAEAGPLVKSLMSTALYAYENDRPQRALMHYLLAAHAGIEAAQHNAGHLYAHVMPGLQKDQAATYRQRALQYFKLAVLQNNMDAQVQLANLLVESEEYPLAVRLYQEAGRAGSTDALFHLGELYWRGKGVTANRKTAWALWQSSDFKSKHAKLSGLKKPVFGVARFIVEHRAFLLFAAGLGAIVATGGNPIEIVQRAMGGGAQQQNTWVEDDDEEDLFGGFEDTPAPAAEDSAPVDEDE